MNKAELVFEKLAKKDSERSKGEKQFIAGAGAGLISTSVTMPLENIQINQATRLKQPFTKLVKDMYKTEGLGAFYKGTGVKLLKVVPTMGITFGAYELLKNKL